jgi:cation diffusion facilitator family transporter
MRSVARGLQASGIAMATNIVLAVAKVATGILGNSYALIADGIESTTDVVGSLVVWSGLRISARPPDQTHPYGHGKAESIAGVMVALILIGAALFIALQSVREIRVPHGGPAPYTLVVLGLVMVTKEMLYRFVFTVGTELESTSLRGDAWHHRVDALTSLAAFIGISIALVGGEGYETADDWAALVACGVILYNGARLLRPAVDEVMDAAVPETVEAEVRALAEAVPGVQDVEKCRIRKSGLGLLMDLHVTVDGEMSVRAGHDIGHAVKDELMASELPVIDVVVHVEPDGL